MNLDNLKIIIFLFFIGVFIEVIISIFSYKKVKKKKQELKNRCSCLVNAVCVDRYKVEYNASSRKLPDYFVIWQFYLNNQLYNIEYKVKVENFAEIGENSVLYINPYNMQEYIKEETEADRQRLKKAQQKVFLFLLFCLIFSVIGILGIYFN